MVQVAIVNVEPFIWQKQPKYRHSPTYTPPIDYTMEIEHNRVRSIWNRLGALVVALKIQKLVLYMYQFC